MSEKLFSPEDKKMKPDIKDLFAEGIESEELRVIAMDKLGKENLRNSNEMTIQEFIKYMQTKETSISKSRVNSKAIRSSSESEIYTTSGYSSGPSTSEPRTTNVPQRSKFQEEGHRYQLRNMNNQYNSSSYQPRKFAEHNSSNHYEDLKPYQTQVHFCENAKTIQQTKNSSQATNSAQRQPQASNQVNAILKRECESQRLVGKFIANRKVTRYLCDTGAD